MRNVLDKRCRDNQNEILFSITFFKKSHRLLDNFENVVKTEGPQMTSQYCAHALRAEQARLHAHMSMHTPRTRVTTCTYARTHTHRPIGNTYCFSAATVIR